MGATTFDFTMRLGEGDFYWRRLDTNPVGTCLLRASRNIPRGYIPLDGSVLQRADFPELWSMIEKSGMLVSEAAWSVDQIKYSAGDGANTFRVPNKAVRDDGWIECLKVR